MKLGELTAAIVISGALLSPNAVEARSSGVGKWVSKAVSGLMSGTKKTPSKTSPSLPEAKKDIPRTLPNPIPSSTQYSSDTFYRNMMLVDAGISGVAAVALTPSFLDTVWAAQYRTMMASEKDHSTLLPPNHATTLRIKRITDRLTEAVRRDPSIPTSVKNRMKWEVSVIQKDIINAFCMPWGKMVIYTGIIDRLRLTDDEIAVIMGHEISHALRDHGYKRMKEALWANALISLAWAKTRSIWMVDALYVGNMLLTLKNSRDHEREADIIWLDIVRQAGYDVCAGESVWKKMWAKSKESLPPILSTHPPSKEREKTLHDHVAGLWKTCRTW